MAVKLPEDPILRELSLMFIEPDVTPLTTVGKAGKAGFTLVKGGAKSSPKFVDSLKQVAKRFRGSFSMRGGAVDDYLRRNAASLDYAKLTLQRTIGNLEDALKKGSKRGVEDAVGSGHLRLRELKTALSHVEKLHQQIISSLKKTGRAADKVQKVQAGPRKIGEEEAAWAALKRREASQQLVNQLIEQSLKGEDPITRFPDKRGVNLAEEIVRRVQEDYSMFLKK